MEIERLRRAGIACIVLGLASACGRTTLLAPQGHPSTGNGAGGGDTASVGTGTTSTTPPLHILTTGSSDKVDLLLVVDNSRSMADKQAIFSDAVSDLVGRLVNPKCFDPTTLQPTPNQPQGPLEPCPDLNAQRAQPIYDIHVGVITSSLGSHGADSCPSLETSSCGGGGLNTSNNDMGHLVSRNGPCTTGVVPTYQNQGFLAWDPAGMDSPPGEASLGAIAIDPTTGNVITTMVGIVPSIKDMVLGAGQIGCGYPSQLESWYRFLVDPEPYAMLTVDPNGSVIPMGTDDALLAQRKEFLRPDSALAIIGVTDKNDCSTKEYGNNYLSNQLANLGHPGGSFHLPKARSECATNPNDPCCLSCGQAQTGCPVDPSCGELDAKSDDVNLRCWDQKRRFGIDFLYSSDRYVTALTQKTVPNRGGELVPNPIFVSGLRDPSRVFLSFIVGVPWQDIASDPNNILEGFKGPAELANPTMHHHSTWDYILGDPTPAGGGKPVLPLDPHMIASSSPRSGTNPITGDAIAPPKPIEGGTDAINGHEYTTGTQNGVQVSPNDLEYACIFPLPVPRDCTDPVNASCDCLDKQNDNPLCAVNGMKGRTLQTHAKAYPGLRELSVVKQLANQGMVGSICPTQLTDPSAVDYGYRLAMEGIFENLRPTNNGSSCLSLKLMPDASGRVDCTLFEARNTGMHVNDAACDALCDGTAARVAVPASQSALRAAVLNEPAVKAAGADCVCEIPQLMGAAAPGCQGISSELAACQCAVSDPVLDGKLVSGWCYVDPSTTPPTGNPQIVYYCPNATKRQVRIVGLGQLAPNSISVLACNGQ